MVHLGDARVGTLNKFREEPDRTPDHLESSHRWLRATVTDPCHCNAGPMSTPRRSRRRRCHTRWPGTWRG
jgi:hypothetical protein